MFSNAEEGGLAATGASAVEPNQVVGNTVTPTKGAKAGDGEVTILDATMIQRWLVDLSAADGIGKPIG